MLLLTSYKSLSQMLPVLTVQLGLYAKEEEAENAIKEKGVLLTLKEIATKIANKVADLLDE